MLCLGSAPGGWVERNRLALSAADAVLRRLFTQTTLRKAGKSGAMKVPAVSKKNAENVNTWLKITRFPLVTVAKLALCFVFLKGRYILTWCGLKSRCPRCFIFHGAPVASFSDAARLCWIPPCTRPSGHKTLISPHNWSCWIERWEQPRKKTHPCKRSRKVTQVTFCVPPECR